MLDQLNKQQLLNMIAAAQDAAIEMHIACTSSNLSVFAARTTFKKGADDTASAYRIITTALTDNCKTNTLILACESIVYSLERIVELYAVDRARCAHRIEFEMLPLMQIFYADFYYWEIACDDAALLKKYLEHDRFALGANSYIDRAEETGQYKYEVSICVFGYNEVSYTANCINSLLKYIPDDLSCEIILVNHGSTDGTRDLFEKIGPNKHLDIYRNGGGMDAVSKIIEGRYFLGVSNDVLLTENAIENMLACIKSDPDIACVVPATSNISNNQEIELQYDGMDEMYEAAAKNNKQDPLRWEQRTRLCNPIGLYSSKHFYSSKGILFHTYKILDDPFAFPDDKFSLLLRRRGLKMMLAKDAYCHHYGQVTIKVKDWDYYEPRMRSFKETFGIFPWSKGFCYDPPLFIGVELAQKHNATILGISPGIGSNPLKFKTMLRELGSQNTELFIASEDAQFVPDYKTYTEPHRIEIVSDTEFANAFAGQTFDYITVEAHIIRDDVFALRKRLRPGGTMAIWCEDAQMAKSLHRTKQRSKIYSANDLYEGTWYFYGAEGE